MQPPQPADPWDGIKNATGLHEDCPQRNIYIRSQEIIGVEDCLYLNVYSPKVSILCRNVGTKLKNNPPSFKSGLKSIQGVLQ